MPPKIVVIAGEVGVVANALAPVVEMLRGGRVASVDSFACREAVSTWRQRKVDFGKLDDDNSTQDVRSLLANASPDLVLVGTGVEEVDSAIHLEKRFVVVAREQRIPSLGLLDYWNNYVRRFYTPDGEPLYLPDRIALMDERARRNDRCRNWFRPSDHYRTNLIWMRCPELVSNSHRLLDNKYAQNWGSPGNQMIVLFCFATNCRAVWKRLGSRLSRIHGKGSAGGAD